MGGHAPSHSAPKASSNGGGGASEVMVEGAFGGILGMFMGLVCMSVQALIGGKH